MADLKRILVVEDDATLRQLYSDLLTGAGYEVETAADGESAQSLLTQGGYDLVLLDLVMPKIDGITVLKNLQQNPPAVPNRHIVVLSNLGKDDIVGEAIANGANAYLIKSDYTPDQILSQISTFLNS